MVPSRPLPRKTCTGPPRRRPQVESYDIVRGLIAPCQRDERASPARSRTRDSELHRPQLARIRLAADGKRETEDVAGVARIDHAIVEQQAAGDERALLA